MGRKNRRLSSEDMAFGHGYTHTLHYPRSNEQRMSRTGSGKPMDILHSIPYLVSMILLHL